MDNVTHALAGLLIADVVRATRRARGTPLPDAATGTLTVAGVISAELPDIDLLWSGIGRGPETLGYLLHHRGHTHTVVVALAAAALVWGLALALRPAMRRPDASRALLVTCLLGTLSHVALDWTNSYGVHPFWPVANAWHYGDAVFIVEPWLWVAAIPFVVHRARARGTRWLLGALLVAILAAAWLTGTVAPAMAGALTAATALAIVLARRAGDAMRATIALGAWLAIEGTFFTFARAAERAVRDVVPAAADVVLTPGAADPLCWSVLVVDTAAATYRVRSAVVRPAPALRAAASCRVRAPTGLRPADTAASARVRVTGEWTAPVAELVALGRDCRLAAALRFVRVPAWARDGATTALWDLRYGRGSFASVTSRGRGACPTGVPPWEAPRRSMLGAAR